MMKKLLLLSAFLIIASIGYAFSANLDDIYETVPDINNCQPGVLKHSEKQAILDYINQIRALHHLPAVTWADDKDDESMKASLMCVANNDIDHFPPASWECYTSEGADACAKSNLAYAGFSGSNYPDSKTQIAGWMMDNNSGNAQDKVGHRRAIINPFLTKISVGRCDGVPKVGGGGFNVSAMNLFYQDFTDGNISSSDIDFIAYPYGNYPPELVDLNFLLNFSPIYDKTNLWGNTNIDYSQAVIMMKDANGNDVPVDSKGYDNEGWGSIPTNMTWKLTNGIQRDMKYTVSIKNVIVNGESKDYSYWFNVTNDTATVKPTAPVLSSPANNSTELAQDLILKWQQTPTALRYHFQMSENQDMSSPIYDENNIGLNQFSASSLKSNTKYFWRVTASNAIGESDWSEEWSFTTINKTNLIPTLFLPANNSTDIELPVSFSWNNVSASEGYYLQVAPTADFNLNTLVVLRSNLTDNSLKVTSGLTAGKTYYWRVAAKFNGEFGDWSDVWQFSVLGNNPGPAAVYPTDSSTEIALTPKIEWQPLTSAIAYNFKLATNASFEAQKTLIDETGISDAYYNILNGLLNNNSIYYWKVQGNLGAGNYTDWSKTYVFTTKKNGGVFDIASFDAALSISPMPAINTISLKSDKLTLGNGLLSVYDLNGNIAICDQIVISADFVTVEVSSLIKGTYFVTLTEGDKTFGSVFVKE